MDETGVIQSEVSQKEKHQYSILMYIYMEFRKMVTMALREGNGNPLQYSCLENPMDRVDNPWDPIRVGHD